MRTCFLACNPLPSPTAGLLKECAALRASATGAPPSAASVKWRHHKNQLHQGRHSIDPADKGRRRFLAAARAAGPLRRCEPCAQDCLQSSKGARARADGEASGRAGQILLHFSYPGELSEGANAVVLARKHFYVKIEGGARGAQKMKFPGPQKPLRKRRSAAQSTFQRAQLLLKGPTLKHRPAWTVCEGADDRTRGSDEKRAKRAMRRVASRAPAS